MAFHVGREAPADTVSGDGDRLSGVSLSFTEVTNALATQSRVVMAIVLRETLNRYGQHKLGFLWALVEPIVVVSLFVVIVSSFRTGSPGGMPMTLFMITGFVPFMLFRNPMTQMQGGISAGRSLLSFPQVTTFDVILAKGLLECAVILLVFPFLLFMAHVIGFDVRVENPLGVLAVCLLLATLGSGLGFLFAALVPIIPSIKQITTPVLGRPLFLASGLFYTAGSLPASVRDWLLYNPVLHMMELMRSEFFHEFESAYGNWRYASLWAVGTLALGLVTHQALRRRATVGL